VLVLYIILFRSVTRL